MAEIWKTIPDFPNYSVSDRGRIRRDGRILKPRPGHRNKAGIPFRWHVGLYRDGKSHTRHVHRLVLETFVGKPPEGMECCHNDGDPANNRLENLRWDTSRANGADMIKHGNSCRGDKHYRAKLTESKVKEIKRSLERFSGRGACTELAGRFGVAQETISNIKTGRNWGWL